MKMIIRLNPNPEILKSPIFNLIFILELNSLLKAYLGLTKIFLLIDSFIDLIKKKFQILFHLLE